MAIFNSYVKLPEGMFCLRLHAFYPITGEISIVLSLIIPTSPATFRRAALWNFLASGAKTALGWSRSSKICGEMWRGTGISTKFSTFLIDMYIYICLCVCVCIYIYVYLYHQKSWSVWQYDDVKIWNWYYTCIIYPYGNFLSHQAAHPPRAKCIKNRQVDSTETHHKNQGKIRGKSGENR